MKYINEYNDYEKNLFNQVNSKPEVYIASLLQDLQVEHSNNNIVFSHKESGDVWMEYNKGINQTWVSYDHIWEIIQSKFPYSDNKIGRLLQSTVKMLFNIDIGLPVLDY